MSFQEIISYKDNLERILDNLKEGIIAHDLDRRIFFFNHWAEKITGYSREEMIGKDCHEAFGCPFCGERCHLCSDSITFQDKDEYPVVITTKSGEQRRIEMSVTLMKDGQGGHLGVLASFRDVTDLLDLKIRAKKLTSFSEIIGRDDKMLQIFQQIRDVALYDYPVHISGETGTGKELVANAIHNESPRAGAPFVPINCGALPEGLIESELFGHVKGAFTGAVRDKKGRFELADGGTIFLDEVADLSKIVQVKLLRFLQEGTFERVGGEKTISVSVKVTSATNKDLKAEVKKKNFREDLYYRLNVIPIHLPPLRDRKTDIPLLVEHFLFEARDRYPNKNPKISRTALSRFMDYHWPGNIRELQNAVQFAIVKSNGRIISPEDLPFEIAKDSVCQIKRGPVPKLDKEKVSQVLVKTGGNKAKAAKLLGVGRATLYRFLTDHPDLWTDGSIQEIFP